MRHYIYDDNSGLVLGYDPLEPENFNGYRPVLEQYPATDAEEANQLICQLYLKLPELALEVNPLIQYLDNLLYLNKRTHVSHVTYNFYRHQAYGAVMYHTMEHPEDERMWFHLWTYHYREKFGF